MIEETSHKRTKLSSLCFVLKGQLKYQNWKKKKKKVKDLENSDRLSCRKNVH